MLVGGRRGPFASLLRAIASAPRVLPGVRRNASRGAGVGNWRRAHGCLLRPGARARLRSHRDRLAGHEPSCVALLAQAWVQDFLPSALSLDPVKVPILSGT